MGIANLHPILLVVMMCTIFIMVPFLLAFTRKIWLALYFVALLTGVLWLTHTLKLALQKEYGCDACGITMGKVVEAVFIFTAVPLLAIFLAVGVKILRRHIAAKRFSSLTLRSSGRADARRSTHIR
jgi:heme O synthase-like polyprenyltransferase